LGTQLVSLPQQHLHAHFAFHPEVSHEKQIWLVPQPRGSPELSPASFFLFSERMFIWLISDYTRKSARTANTYVFKITYGMLGKTEISPGIVLMQA
jgi:hypothetical protein